MSRRGLYRLSAEAAEDLRSIGVYIAADRPAAARRVIQAIRKTFKIVARSPYIGESCEYLGFDLRQITATPPARRYIVFFRPLDDGSGGRHSRHHRRVA